MRSVHGWSDKTLCEKQSVQLLHVVIVIGVQIVVLLLQLNVHMFELAKKKESVNM